LKFIRTFQQTTLAARLVFQIRGNIREAIYRVAGHFVRAFPSFLEIIHRVAVDGGKLRCRPPIMGLTAEALELV
jgi:hypothetical protein